MAYFLKELYFHDRGRLVFRVGFVETYFTGWLNLNYLASRVAEPLDIYSKCGPAFSTRREIVVFFKKQVFSLNYISIGIDLSYCKPKQNI